MHICYHSPQSMTSLHTRYDSSQIVPNSLRTTPENLSNAGVQRRYLHRMEANLLLSSSMDDQHKLCGAYKLRPEGTSFRSRALMPILAILYGFALKINRPAGVNPGFIGSLPCQPPPSLTYPAASIDASSQAAIFPYSYRARFGYTCRIRVHVSTEFG